MSYLAQMDVNKKGSTIPFINNLEIIEIFKDKGKEEEVSVIDLINNNRFNLLSNLVPLIGLRRQIPIGKTSLFIEKKPIFR